MTKKEAILGSAVWRGEDPSYIRTIAQLPVFPRVGINFIDGLTTESNKKQTKIAISGVVEEMKEMKHNRNYLDSVRRSFALAMVDQGIQCEEILPVIHSVINTGVKCSLALDLSEYFSRYGNEESKDELRSFFDKSGGSRVGF